MKPHNHAVYINAFVEGIPVECRSLETNMEWKRVIHLNTFDLGGEFRIKPAEKVVRWLWAFKYSGTWYTHNRYLTDAESEEWFEEHEATSSKKLEWSREEFEE